MFKLPSDAYAAEDGLYTHVSRLQTGQMHNGANCYRRAAHNTVRRFIADIDEPYLIPNLR